VASAITALKASDSLQIAKKQIDTLSKKTVLLQKALTLADSATQAYHRADQLSQSILESKDKELKISSEKYDLSMIYNKSLGQTLKRKNHTITIVSGVSVSIIGSLTYLLLKK
jgi:hypothetical protein